MSASLPLLPTITAPDPASMTDIPSGTVASSDLQDDPTLYQPLALTQTQIFALVWIVLAAVVAWEALSEIGGWAIQIGTSAKWRRRKSVLLAKLLLFASAGLGLGSGVFYAFSSTTMLCKTLATLMYSGAVASAGAIGATTVVAVWGGSGEPPRRDRSSIYFFILLGAAITAAPWIAVVVTMKSFEADRAWQQGYVCSIGDLPKWHLAMWAGQIVVPLVGALAVLFGPRPAGSRRMSGRKVTLLLILAIVGAGCLVRDHFSNDTLMRVNTIGMSMGLSFPFALQILNLQPRAPRYDDDVSDTMSHFGDANAHPREKGGSRDSFELGSVQSSTLYNNTPHGTPRMAMQRQHKPEPLDISSALPTFVSVPPGSRDHLAGPSHGQGPAGPAGGYPFTNYGGGYQEAGQSQQRPGRHVPSSASFPGLWATAMPTEPNTPLPLRDGDVRGCDGPEQQQSSGYAVAGPSSAVVQRQPSKSRKYPPSSSRQPDNHRLSVTHESSAAQASSALSRLSRASSTHSTFNRLLAALKPAGVGTPASTSGYQANNQLQQQQQQPPQQYYSSDQQDNDAAYGGVQTYGEQQLLSVSANLGGSGQVRATSPSSLAVNMRQDGRPLTAMTAYSCESWEADVIYGQEGQGVTSPSSSKRSREREGARSRETRVSPANGWDDHEGRSDTRNHMNLREGQPF